MQKKSVAFGSHAGDQQMYMMLIIITILIMTNILKLYNIIYIVY